MFAQNAKNRPIWSHWSQGPSQMGKSLRIIGKKNFYCNGLRQLLVAAHLQLVWASLKTDIYFTDDHRQWVLTWTIHHKWIKSFQIPIVPDVRDLNLDGAAGFFSYFAGIPTIDLKFIGPEINLTDFPAQFDNYRLVRSVLDQKLANLQTCAKMILANLRHLVIFLKKYFKTWNFAGVWTIT